MNKHKYKDRKPEETIEIIKKFFIDFNIKFNIEEELYEIDNLLFSSKVILKFNNIEILSANGKGLTKEYSLASAYGELYERFCIGAFPYNGEYYLSLYQKNNTTSDINLLTFSNNLPENKKKYLKNLLLQIYKNNIPYNIFNNLINKNNNNKKINLLAQQLLTGSNGFACGNSEEEAIVMSICELIERYYQYLFLNFPKELSIYKINYNNIKNNNILKIIKILKNKYNIDLKFFTIKQAPVIISCAFDKKNMKYLIKFGVFPDLDIALERSITEIFQNNNNNNNNNNSLSKDWQFFMPNNKNDYINFDIYRTGRINYDLLYLETLSEINELTNFADNLKSNKDCLSFLLTFCKYNNIDLYYYNYSLSKNLYVSLIVSDTLNQYINNLFLNNINYDLDSIKIFKNINKNNFKNFIDNFNEEYYQFLVPSTYDFIPFFRKYLFAINAFLNNDYELCLYFLDLIPTYYFEQHKELLYLYIISIFLIEDINIYNFLLKNNYIEYKYIEALINKDDNFYILFINTFINSKINEHFEINKNIFLQEKKND